MNKKILLFSILGVFALTMASALVVNYYSNKAQLDVQVQSPFLLQTSTDGVTFEEATLDIGSVYAGDEFNYKLKSNYYGQDVATGLFIVGNVTNDNDNADCDDFSEMKITAPTDIHLDGSTTIPAGTPVSVLSMCDDSSGNPVIKIPAQFGFNEADREQEYDISIKFNMGIVPSEYTFEHTVE